MSCARSSPRRANRSPARRTRGVRAAAATAAEADGWGGRLGAGAWRCCGSGAGVATSTEYEVRSSSDGGWARGGVLVLSTGAMRRSTSPEKAHGAQGDRIRCAHSRHGVGTEASAVHKGAVARAAIRNEAGAAHIQSERTVALGHCQRGQIDLVLRVPTDPDGAAPSQERRWPPRQARLRKLARRRHAGTAGAEPSANTTLGASSSSTPPSLASRHSIGSGKQHRR